ncbi:MAG: NUDIX domain-containing protein [Candidatus Izimaplasma sp.]|nr:NUDIX domain-containing protein [Candidatus Izimaplasma bacterium]
MKIEIFADDLTKEDCDLSNHRVGCRGIIKKDDLYLMVRVPTTEIFTFPGGGVEESETLEDCVKREVLEETGIDVKVLELKVSITEYFAESVWTNHYFLCDFVSDKYETNLTEEEIEVGLETHWKTLEEVLDIFENYETIHEFGPVIHNREFLGFINSI